MTRTFAAKIANILVGHASSERYPTRSVEYMLAWMMMAWSCSLLIPGIELVGPQYKFLLMIMPEVCLAFVGITAALSRLFALLRNGSWSKSPYLRLLGASAGYCFWSMLFIAYGLAFLVGAAKPFPMFFCLPVFMFFEVYSAFRCGQDAQQGRTMIASE